MRSLYLRLVIGFAVVLALSVFALWRAYSAVTLPSVGRMISGSQAAQAEEAAEAMRRGGPPAAAEYLERLDAITQMPHYLTDAGGRDVVSSEDRSNLVGPVSPPSAPGARARSYVDDERVVFVTPSRDGTYRLITLAPLPFTIADFVPYVALITGAIAVLFWLLAADIVRPVRRLGEALQRFGRGDLGARSSVTRRDEIGLLATAFNDMAARIETLVTAERRLLQDVSHELRSPLTRLNLAIELSRTAPDREQAADRLQREATRLSDLVATLLEVVRLEGDPGATPTAPVRLRDLLHESVESVGVEYGPRGIRVEMCGDREATISGNAELLRRAFDNIIGNAARYSPPGGTVAVTCGSSAAEYVIAVRDTGPGVPDHQLARLGDAFFRADDSRNSSTGGVGLGLAIAKRAIHLHRGTLEMENAHPGLRVTMRIPLADRDRGAQL